MKAYEAGKKLGMSGGDFAKEYGLKSHLSKLPDKLERELFGDPVLIHEEETITMDSAETVVVGETKDSVLGVDGCPVGRDELLTSLVKLGGASPYIKWDYLLDG